SHQRIGELSVVVHESDVASTCQMQTPNNSTQLMGRKYFRQVIMTWSIRSRGKVQRTHIITNTPPHPLRMKTAALIRLPNMGPRNVSLNSTGSNPEFQPPKNIVAAMPETANMLPYSAMKNNSHRNPEYSV